MAYYVIYHYGLFNFNFTYTLSKCACGCWWCWWWWSIFDGLSIAEIAPHADEPRNGITITHNQFPGITTTTTATAITILGGGHPSLPSGLRWASKLRQEESVSEFRVIIFREIGRGNWWRSERWVNELIRLSKYPLDCTGRRSGSKCRSQTVYNSAELK